MLDRKQKRSNWRLQLWLKDKTFVLLAAGGRRGGGGGGGGRGGGGAERYFKVGTESEAVLGDSKWFE